MIKALKLNKETLRVLQVSELASTKVDGGTATYSVYQVCISDTCNTGGNGGKRTNGFLACTHPKTQI